MKWIKTKAKMPELLKDIVVKSCGTKRIAYLDGDNKFYDCNTNVQIEVEEWLDESEEETIPTLDLISNIALQASIGKLRDNERKMVITTTCMNKEQAQLFLQDMQNKLQEELEKRNNEITDTQRLDWLEKALNEYDVYEVWDYTKYSLREFIDKQIKP